MAVVADELRVPPPLRPSVVPLHETTPRQPDLDEQKCRKAASVDASSGDTLPLGFTHKLMVLANRQRG